MPKVRACFEAAALATGCRVTIDADLPYLDLLTNEPLGELYMSIARENGLEFKSKDEQLAVSRGSTDMGNVSWFRPSFHVVYDIGAKEGIHTVAFREAAKSGGAFEACFLVAKVLALVGLRFAQDGMFRAEVINKHPSKFT